MQVIEVDCKVLGPGRGDVMLGVDNDAGVIALFCIEQSQTCHSIQSIVVSELC